MWQADVLALAGGKCAPGSFDVGRVQPAAYRAEEMAGLQPSFFHEPRMALRPRTGHSTSISRPLISGALEPGGCLILEIIGVRRTLCVSRLLRDMRMCLSAVI